MRSVSNTSRKSAVGLIVAVLTAIVVALLVTGQSDSAELKATTQPVKAGHMGNRDARLKKERSVVATKIAATTVQLWSCQDRLTLLGARDGRDQMQSPWSLPKSVAYRQWVLNQRIHKRDVCKKRLRYISTHLIPDIQDWLGAVQWVQSIYPGTENWMRYISDREGGWGSWVWYGGRGWSGYHVGDDFLGADTVGGWMQFRYSTFAPYWRGAQKDLLAKGYILPNFRMPSAGGDPKYAAWLNPMGQALTAGYMKFYGKEGCHWCL